MGRSANPRGSFRIYTRNMPNQQSDKGQGTFGRARQRLDQAERTGAAFLITDLEVAMTLIRIASNAAEDSEKRIRNRANARHAYDAVSRISSHAVLTDEERQDVDEKLAELRSALQGLGEFFA